MSRYPKIPDEIKDDIINDKDLGVLSDFIIAERYDVSRQFISRFIVKNRIKRDRNKLNIELMLSFIDTEDEGDIARRFRIPIYEVRKIKRFLGIDNESYDSCRDITKTSLCDYCLLRRCPSYRTNILNIVISKCNSFV